MPGLLPNKREWDEQRESVRKAVDALRAQGVEADGHVVATRKAAKRIVREAAVRGCDEIVMGADRSRTWLLADFMWTQEPQRVRRKADIPVHLVEEPEGK
jgi:nucleotide-binding universal stress UspA family protein